MRSSSCGTFRTKIVTISFIQDCNNFIYSVQYCRKLDATTSIIQSIDALQFVRNIQNQDCNSFNYSVQYCRKWVQQLHLSSPLVRSNSCGTFRTKIVTISFIQYSIAENWMQQLQLSSPLMRSSSCGTFRTTIATISIIQYSIAENRCNNFIYPVYWCAPIRAEHSEPRL